MAKSGLVEYTNISKNKTYPRTKTIDKIVIYAVNNNVNCKTLTDKYATSGTRAPNYTIGNDGKIGCSVEEQYCPHATSDNYLNNRSIVIDIATDKGTYNNAVNVKLKELLRDLAKRVLKTKKLTWTGNGSDSLYYSGWAGGYKSDYLYNNMGNLADTVNAQLGTKTNYYDKAPKTGTTKKGNSENLSDTSAAYVQDKKNNSSSTTNSATEALENWTADKVQQAEETAGVSSATYSDEFVEEEVFIEWSGDKITQEEYEQKLEALLAEGDNYTINNSSAVSFKGATTNLAGIFGMPYQFSTNVDPVLRNSDGTSTEIGRKFNEKVFAVAPVLFLTPGEPKFMAGYGKSAKQKMASKMLTIMSGEDDEDTSDFDDGRYYSFESNFPEFKKYPNVALRALALYMGIGDVSIPVPGKDEMIKLKNMDIEGFMNNDFTKLFGTQCVVPFFLNAETSISESFTNSTTESVLAQSTNSMSQSAREIQFIMGSKDYGGLLGSIGSAITDVSSNITSALGNVAEALTGKNLLTRLSNELTTVVSGGKIIFPEIYAGSEYSRSFDISIKLRSPDPDPVSIFLNIYMPIILLLSMAAPRQIGHSSNSYESPFLVRATYKSIFTSDLAIIQSISINKGGEGTWNTLGQPLTADINLDIKDLYSSFFISKRMGLICNTVQMDYLAMMAGIDMNEFEPTRMINLTRQIVSNTPRDWTSDMWGGIKKALNQKASSVLSSFADTRFLS